MTHHVRLFVLAFIAMAFVGNPALGVAAQDATPSVESAPTPRFSIQPVGDYPEGYFTVELAPGASTSLTAVVRTTKDSAPVALRVYRTNSFNVVNGGFGAMNEEDAPTGATSWVNVAAESFSLDPAQERQVSITVTVPADAKPGQYVVALVAQTDGAVEIPGLDTLKQVIRSAISVGIVVPGEATHGFTLGDPEFNNEGAAPRLVIPVTSTGNYLVKPAGELTISTPDGKEIVKAPIAMGSVYGGNATTLEISLPTQLPPGDYVVAGTLTDPESKATATIEKTPVTLAERDTEPPRLILDPVTVTANADPIQFADVAITVANTGATIPTATVTLQVSKDGKPLEAYPLAQNQALPQGQATISQRYIPAKGWSKGTYSFEIVIASVDASTGTETQLVTMSLEDTIVVP